MFIIIHRDGTREHFASEIDARRVVAKGDTLLSPAGRGLKISRRRPKRNFAAEAREARRDAEYMEALKNESAL